MQPQQSHNTTLLLFSCNVSITQASYIFHITINIQANQTSLMEIRKIPYFSSVVLYIRANLTPSFLGNL